MSSRITRAPPFLPRLLLHENVALRARTSGCTNQLSRRLNRIRLADEAVSAEALARSILPSTATPANAARRTGPRPPSPSYRRCDRRVGNHGPGTPALGEEARRGSTCPMPIEPVRGRG